MAGNCGATSLRRRGRDGSAMGRYDRLPRDLRHWLAEARLPWSPASALKAWQRALDQTQGNRDQARRVLSGLEMRLLERDAPHVWGRGHPLAGD